MSNKPTDNFGSLNINNNRRPDKNDPHAKGSVKIDGVDYWISAWTKVNQDGTKWQSLSFNKKDPNYKKPAQFSDPVDGDEIPF